MKKQINLDDIMRHQAYLARLETSGYRSHIAPSLAITLRDIKRLLADVETGITSQRQLRAIEAAITKAIQANSGWAALESDLNDLAIYENEWQQKLIGAGVAASDERVKRLAANTMMSLRSGERFNTGFIIDFMRDNLGAQAAVVNNIVRRGYSEGATINELRRQITQAYDGIISREAEALARTATNHYSSVGRRAFVDANKDLNLREYPLVTFDNRTSDTCISISAQYAEKGWPAGESPIGYQPWHFGCRSTVIARAEGQEVTGTRSAVGGQSDGAEAFAERNSRRRAASQVRYRGKRDADIFKAGQIKASTTIDTWLRQQPAWFQDDMLGPTRAKMFRDGELSLRNLTDAAKRPLTLAEIRAREGG